MIILVALLSLIAAVGASSLPAAKRPALVAHRGESHDAPENTLAAVQLAWDRGDEAAEIDVCLSADGHLVVCHDADTKRTAGVKHLIRETTLADLRKLDVGRWKGEKFAGERMPTLDEVLATIPAGRRLLVEVKCGPEAIAPLVRAIDASKKRPEQVWIISFSAAVIEKAKQALPSHHALFLASFKQDEKTRQWAPTVDSIIATARRIRADGISLSGKGPWDANLVKKAREAGLEIHVWTIDAPDQARRLIDLGVDSITTNRAAWLREQLGK